MKHTLYLIALLVVSLQFISCKQEVTEKIKTPKITFTKEGTVQLYKSKVDTLITSFDVELAETDYETQTGLMYRSKMEQNHGMFFMFKTMNMHSFYMKNTEIPLDIIFINDAFKIVSFQENAQAFNETSLPSKVPAQYVLEINAGLAEQYLLEVGDSIVLLKD